MRFLVVVLCALLAACGGGGSGSGGSGGSGGTPGGGSGGGTGGGSSGGGGTPQPVCYGDALCWPAATPSEISGSTTPQVILLMLLDDADYHDVGYFSTDAVTPNIDQIAQQGVRLSRFYAAGPVCSPTRASIISGREPAYFGLNFLWEDHLRLVPGQYYNGKRGMPGDIASLPRSLQASGYHTFHIGKWHIGSSAERFLPTGVGFETYEMPDGFPYAGLMRVRTDKGDKKITTEWRPKYEAERIIAYIDERIARGERIFINWWPFEPHVYQENGSNYYVPPTFNQAAYTAATGRTLDTRTERGKLLSIMFSLDVEFGKVIQHLKDKGLYNDTLTIVTSDNGGFYGGLSPTRIVRGSKSTLSEGGIRVPFAAAWPNRFKAGTHSSLPMVTSDLFPTIMALVGGTVPQGINGIDASSVLLRGTGTHPPILFQTRRAVFRKNDNEFYTDSFALVSGCDKFFVDEGASSYWDVCADPDEKSDLSKSKASRFADLRSQLFAHRLDVSRYASVSSLSAVATYPATDRLDIASDDLSIYATLNATDHTANGSHTIYQRGEGVTFGLRDGILTANLVGVPDTTPNPVLRNLTLSAPVPRDGRDHRVALVIRGYFVGGATIRLFVDDRLVDERRAPINSQLVAGPSVLSLKSELVPMQLGDATLPLKDVQVYVNAIEPSEF